MKKILLNLLSWALILLSPVLIFIFFGYLAIRFDVWPPSCGVLPIPQARQVCEFSKLDKAPVGKPAKLSFWTTVPYNTPLADKIFLVIKGREPAEMKRVNSTTFEVPVPVTTGEDLVYRYLRKNENSVSEEKQLKVKWFEKTIYDYVSAWSDLKIPFISKALFPSVEMYDTWSINYNFQFFEDTRKNLDSAMARIRDLGGKEIGVYSFIEMLGDKDNFVVQEDPPMPTFIWGQLKHKYGRDGAITADEMEMIAQTARKYGLKTTLYYNMGADYTKYINITPNPFAARGSGGNTAENRAGTDFGRYESKTKEWLDRYFGQLKNVLVDWAKRAENAGIDAFDLNPHYRPPTVDPLNDYADAKWLEIITAIREVYKGKIYFDGNPKFRDVVDGLYYSIGIRVRPNASILEMRQAWIGALNQVEANLASYKKPIFLKVGAGSYDGATSGKSGMEFADYIEVEQAGYKRNWQEQADAYEAFFQALAGRTSFAGVVTQFFAWDDFMGPEYTPVRYNDLGASIRNKPAEAVWKKWVLSGQ
ncbi:MAG: hypothetical protein HZB99_02295 [Candidatus Harrisonbacteria bacterium]|nr:hypothetical protein [Candidatus Harrisonbacteria bacterium]